MSEDRELELLKRRRLLEMQRRFLLKKAEELAKGEERAAAAKPKGAKEVLRRVFVGRAWEVWDAAERQYPKVAERIAAILASLVESGRLRGKVTGEQLFWLFKQMGVPVRLRTRIRLYDGGELKTIAEKLRER